MRRAHLIVPGICFLLLGLGNLWVGHYKGSEYAEVSRRLNSAEFRQGEAYLPLARINQDKAFIQRSLDRRLKAFHRTEFYSMVFVIGECSTVIGLLLIGSSLLFIKRRTNKVLLSSNR